MSDIVIRAEALGKRYALGASSAPGERYVALRDVIADRATRLMRSARGGGKRPPAGDAAFWALKDVNFEIQRGDVVGIIGRNGAGKSTLLKILSRITEPSAGRVEINGRVASLLEVGTGFHPELTGRENIFLNGAILGMSRAEIRRKFDEIVAFAEVEQFLDTPVKRYSSGMYVRLAFAVAAHLEAEILIVDEVLAVGDAEFQKKCLGKMEEVAVSGRTVLFVSHNIGSISSVCDYGMLLKQGTVEEIGALSDVIETYKRSGRDRKAPLTELALTGPLTAVRFDALELNGKPLNAYNLVLSSEAMQFRIAGRSSCAIADFRFAFAVFLDGVRVFTLHDGPARLESGGFEIAFAIPANFLRPGQYDLALGGRRVSGDEWVWGADVARIEILPQYSRDCDADNAGIVNCPSRISRRALTAAP